MSLGKNLAKVQKRPLQKHNPIGEITIITHGDNESQKNATNNASNRKVSSQTSKKSKQSKKATNDLNRWKDVMKESNGTEDRTHPITESFQGSMTLFRNCSHRDIKVRRHSITLCRKAGM